jgi:hypothetical protein
MVYEYEIEGLKVRTGDLICTSDGAGGDLRGQFWRLIGKLLPGDVDHIVVYLGPDGRCIEAGARGKVITFELTGDKWVSQAMVNQRGPLIDEFFGIAYPLNNRGLDSATEAGLRHMVSEYCLAREGKPYNLNFLDSSTENAFYCSQLAYKAYLKAGIDLNTGVGVPDLPFTESIIFPQEIWSGCFHSRGQKKEP